MSYYLRGGLSWQGIMKKKLTEGLNSAAEKPGFKIAVILIDIDDFKMVNDTYGYETGDKLLILVSERLKEAAGEFGSLFRIGSDEFAIVLYDYKKQVRVKRKVEEILDEFKEAVEFDRERYFLSLSIGIALSPKDGDNCKELMKNADIAMLISKSYGKNKCNYYDKEMKNKIIKSVNMENDLMGAVIDNQFTLYYQPQVDVSAQKVYGLEALLRWEHPKLGIIEPSCYIDIVEKNGMICKIGKYVLVEACREILRLKKKGINNLIIFVNISAKQLEDKLFSVFYEETLDSMNVEGKYISIELTERTLLKTSETVINNITAIRDRGTKIYIDDFGTKYASLNCLANFPVDGIKIDRSFIKDISSESKKLIILKNIIRLAKELKLDVITEGVEEAEQVEHLIEIGCNIMQGYIFSKPMPSEEIIKKLSH